MRSLLALLLLVSAPAVADAPDAQALTRLVDQDCGACHGITRKGGLGPDIRAGTLAGRDPGTIGAIILDGIPGTAMPPWRPLLSEDEVRWITRYIMTETIR